MQSLSFIASLNLFISFTRGFKFLAYNPQFGNSHVNYIGKISDILVDAGHEVVILSPRTVLSVGTAGAKKARVIEIPQCEKAKEQEEKMSRVLTNIWNTKESITNILGFVTAVEAFTAQCNATLSHPGLMEQLRSEHFDAAFSEMIDYCGFGIFHHLGITKFAITHSLATIDGLYEVTHAPSNPAYVPALNGGAVGEEMTFAQRIFNTIAFLAMQSFARTVVHWYNEPLQQHFSGMPPVKEVVMNASLVFLNTEPLVDFPRPTAARVIEIGGIIVSTGQKPLNQTWSEVMKLRPQTVLFSFGSYFKAYQMPTAYKKTLRETFAAFPDVTFIWKYEKPEHNVSGGLENVIESTWLPQVDILHDMRLSAFITHCGQGSVTEAIDAGVPLVAIPVSFDQLRNAQQVKRNGHGVVLDRTDLEEPGALGDAIREVLNNEKYAENARKLSAMVRERPFAAKDIFVRNMEFLAKFGPLRQLDHYGTRLNFFQYYLIDVMSFLTAFVLIFVSFTFVIVRLFARIVVYTTSRKQKRE